MSLHNWSARKNSRLITAVFAFVATLGICSQSRGVGFSYDLRSSGTDPKNIIVSNSSSDYTLELWGQVTDVNGDPTKDGLQFGNLSIQSTQVSGGGLTAGSITGINFTSLFQDPIYTIAGAAANLTDDGIGDWGSNTEWTGAPDTFRPASLIRWFVDSSNYTNSAGVPVITGGSPITGLSRAVNVNTWEWKIATVTIHIPESSLSSAAMGITQFAPVFANFPDWAISSSYVVNFMQDDANIDDQYTALHTPRSTGTAVNFISNPQWGVDSGGSWNTTDNWFGGLPNSISMPANFLDQVKTGYSTITLDGNKVVKSLQIQNNLQSYIINPGTGGSLTIGDSTHVGTALIAYGTHEVNVPVIMPNPASTFTVNGGAAVTVSSITTPGTITVNGSGRLTVGSITGQGNVIVEMGAAMTAKSLSLTSLSVNAGLNLLPSNSGGGPIVLGTANAETWTTLSPGALTIGPLALIDLNDNILAINYAPGNSPLESVKTALAAGFFGEGWGIVSTNGFELGYILGYGENTSIGMTDVNGIPVGDSTVIVKLAVPGDANLDGIVNIDDYLILRDNYHTNAGWTEGDFDYSGYIDVDDYLILRDNYKQTLTLPLAMSQGSEMPLSMATPSVPEPGTLSLLGMSALGLLARRRK